MKSYSAFQFRELLPQRHLLELAHGSARELAICGDGEF
jgi:hypothetical protein